MSTAIVKPEVQELESALGILQAEAKEIVGKGIITPEQYERAGQRLVAVKNYEKDVHNKLDAFVEIPRRAYEAARQERQRYLNQAEEVKALLSGPMAEFKRREREAAAAEERRLNEERMRAAAKQAEDEKKERERIAKETREKRVAEIRAMLKRGEIGKREAARLLKEAGADEEAAKAQAAADAEAAKNAPPPPVTVLPSTPKVAGLRGRVNYYADVVDADKLLAAWAAGAPERKAYLGQFITIDEQALNAEARKVKDSRKLEAMIPGIKGRDEDSI